MVILPSRPHSELVHLNSSAPQVDLAFKAKGTDQDPGTTQHRGQVNKNINIMTDTAKKLASCVWEKYLADLLAHCIHKNTAEGFLIHSKITFPLYF